MRLSEYQKLRVGFVDAINNEFGRDMSADEVVEYLFDNDLIDVDLLEAYVKGN